MPTRKKWKKERTFKYEVDNGEILATGTVTANSVALARQKARQETQKLGYTWGKKWHPGWIRYALEGTQGWIGNNDYEPSMLLWVYVPKEEP